MVPSAGSARYVPHLLLTAMIAIWGASYAAIKAALDLFPPYPVVALRFWIAVACLLPFVRRDFRAQLAACWRGGLATGTALLLGYLLQVKGMTGTSASMGAFLAGLIVPLVGVGGWLWFGARLGRWAVAGLVLSFGGMVLLCWPGEGAGGGPADSPTGVLLQIGSSTSYAGHILLLSHFGRGAPVVAFCLWQLVTVAIGASLVAAWSGSWILAQPTGPVADGWLAIAYLGVFATALGIGVQSKVQHRIPAGTVAILFALQPLFGSLFGWLVRGDRLSALQLVGGLVIVAAVLLSSRDRTA